MAIAETARLIAELALDPRKFTAGADKALGSLGKVEGRFNKLGGIAAKGARTAGANLAKIGVAAAGGVALAVRGGINSLAELEDAVMSVDGAIAQVGKGWTTTGADIAAAANEIEGNVQRAFDDKEITQAATALIRYGKVTEGNLRPAMVVMTDLAARTGSVESASRTLAKALADPTKAAGALRKAGVILTKDQEKTIATMVKAGKTAEAQAFILDQLAKSTGGAAAAMHGPYRDAMLTLADVTEDAQRALAIGFLPLLQKVADRLSTALADPTTIKQIEEFGRGLAGGFEKVLGLADKIPWGQIGDSLKIAGAGGKALFDAFSMMPPWVQTAVLTGWGLNKLTGGALGGIVGELGKGLIKGVLGINAGVVNVRGAVVNGGGGALPGVAGGAAGAARTGMSALSKVFLVGEAIGLALLVKNVADQVGAGAKQQTDAIHEVLNESMKTPQSLADLNIKLAGIDQGLDRLPKDPIGKAIFQSSIDELVKMRAEVVAAIDALSPQSHGKPGIGNPNRKLRVYGEVEDKRGAVNWKKIADAQGGLKAAAERQQQKIEMVRTAAERTRASVDWAKQSIVSAEQAGTAAITAALANQQLHAAVPINVYLNGALVKSYEGATWLQRSTSGGNIRGGAD